MLPKDKIRRRRLAVRLHGRLLLSSQFLGRLALPPFKRLIVLRASSCIISLKGMKTPLPSISAPQNITVPPRLLLHLQVGKMRLGLGSELLEHAL
jgi:hypothetical protein